ncbi:class I SAM-dependent methyltransferase [Allopusillimonas soli]|uniref:Class I SAM-dependent methyltransferase n=1 Tax=Allopusillimonas soli TaxID=659016 RepID=A0A853FCV4_9BURK|nr:class I SAM-dependent methyltransferase [Allopusillimonas soli]NYT37482.1 class I SAM-dependent methyltransferase [Allopusillimonas soli]TEA74539.1 class I SAM-dependent methyltransferase [Allopusillimonas soli]
MKSAHSDTVQSQFDAQAHAYLQSAVHAAGPDLQQAQALVAQAIPHATGRILDAGCGAGHLSFALAGLVNNVMAVDPSPNMLATVRQAAADRGLSNIATTQASAESLPFDDACFCAVTTRYSAHHWLGLAPALGELRRVVKPGGRILVIDVEGDENALVDTHLQAMEVLRDRSHIRDRSPSEWQRLLEAAGFTDIEHQSWPTRLEFSAWVARMRTSPERADMIRTLQREAPSEVRQALAIEPDGSFTMRTGLWWARAA